MKSPGPAMPSAASAFQRLFNGKNGKNLGISGGFLCEKKNTEMAKTLSNT